MSMPRAVAIVLFLLLSIPTSAGPVPIGTISRTQVATIRQTSLVCGMTIFSGDTIDVGPRGNVWIDLRRGGQVHVLENSSVRLTESEGSIHLYIERGRAEANDRIVVTQNSASPVSPQKNRTLGDSGVAAPSAGGNNEGDAMDKDCRVSKSKKSKDRHCDD